MMRESHGNRFWELPHKNSCPTLRYPSNHFNNLRTRGRKREIERQTAKGVGGRDGTEQDVCQQNPPEEAVQCRLRPYRYVNCLRNKDARHPMSPPLANQVAIRR